MAAAKPAAKASGSSGKSSSGPADDGEPTWHLGRERYVKVKIFSKYSMFQWIQSTCVLGVLGDKMTTV
jgi:hypothetical protein